MSQPYSIEVKYPLGHANEGQPFSGATVELRSATLGDFTANELGSTGVYYFATIAPGKYTLWVNLTNTNETFAVGEGDLAGLGYSNGTSLLSTSTEIEWGNPIPADHATRHEAGGSDELLLDISQVDGLSSALGTKVSTSGNESIQGVKEFVDEIRAISGIHTSSILSTVGPYDYTLTTPEANGVIATEEYVDGVLTGDFVKPDGTIPMTDSLDVVGDGSAASYGFRLISMDDANPSGGVVGYSLIARGVGGITLGCYLDAQATATSANSRVKGLSNTDSIVTAGNGTVNHTMKSGSAGYNQTISIVDNTGEASHTATSQHNSAKISVSEADSTSKLELINDSNVLNVIIDNASDRIELVHGSDTSILLMPFAAGTTRTIATIEQTLTGYNHSQGVANTVWTINHNLGYKPIIQTWDSTGAQIVGTIQHVSNNQSTVTFATNQSGAGRCV